MISIYRGMYETPEKFMVFPAPYEEYVMKLERQATHDKKFLIKNLHIKNKIICR